ncbi:MAG: hypothetical protein RR086_01060 [Clostridia bacterium]
MDSLYEVVDNCEYCIVYLNGIQYKYLRSARKFESILRGIATLTEGAQALEPFGVALQSDTLSALKEGLFIEFYFYSVLVVDGMTFDRLLIEIKPEYSGFNIIRATKGKYGGRCYYIGLNKPMKNFYEFLIRVVQR